MKRIALFLALVILVLSLASCGVSTYYRGAGWDCPQEEFYDRYYSATGAKLVSVAAEHGITAYLEGTDVEDDHFLLVVYDDMFTCYFNFSCEELWGKVTADMYFYGENADQLNDYSLQQKYVDFVNHVMQLIAYDMNFETNVFEDAFNNCMTNSALSYEKMFRDDYMIGEVKYGFTLNLEREIGNHTAKTEKGTWKYNYYYFEGLLNGNLSEIVAP